MEILLQSELGDFQDRRTVYAFALKMSFVAVMLSSALICLVLPVLAWAGVLPVPLADAIIYGVVFTWLIGGAVSGVLSLIAGFALHQVSVSRAAFERLSRTDELSGLLNRRAFTEALESVDGEACLAIFDVDRFKAINDRFGHACGDAVIIAVAAVLSSAFSGNAVAARLGGEEFGAIVFGALPEDRAEQIRSVCARLAEAPILAAGHEVSLTVSAGIAEFQPGRQKEAVYVSADKALYLAKALGRNRVVHEHEGLRAAWREHVCEGAGEDAAEVDFEQLRHA